ncbi:polysaccharide deacetylase family protein [Alteraurantiacibacter buctensis]|uniref:Chitooligosaccharide deacetylase n=1 Tax=Alteraurantiacibacter buctensis TaxID=1503981 RepID=A0A844YPB6_9SPHN|nr:polysaccharide deacetylase family protein [Alteraurantiacibacter buctensis]MXO70225.1 polysaccharide deacetylase family protein [Alteraurantiacibacter buctensis]
MIRLVAGLVLLVLAALPGLAGPAAAQDKTIAFSFDDVPRQAGAFFTPDERAIRLIAGLAEGGVAQAGFFVTPGNLGEDAGQGGEWRIRAYVAAGHVIANHSFGHTSLNEMTADEYLADVDQAQGWLDGMPGLRPWFRYPYLHEGRDRRRDAVRAGLARRGLLNAYVTVDNWDWHIDNLANQAQRDGKALDMDALRDFYVETLVSAAEHSDAVARDVLGRSPAQVILLHETDLNALFIADLAAGLQAAGWTIVPIEKAFADPIAGREPDTFHLGGGRITALAAEAGRDPGTLNHNSTNEGWLNAQFAARVLQGE